MPTSRITSTTSGGRCASAGEPRDRTSSPARSAKACAICERPAFPMQTKRTLSAGNGALRGREHELWLRGTAERERERFHSLGNEPVEGKGASPVRDLDQAGLAQDLQVMRDRRLREAERVELADARGIPVRQPVDDREPRRVGERLEAHREALELVRLERRGAGAAARD